MKKTRVICVVIAGLAALPCLAFSLAWGGQGVIPAGVSVKSLLPDLISTNGIVRDEARQKLEALGTNALPDLMAEVVALGRLQKQDRTNYESSPDVSKRNRSLLIAFQILGPVAEPLVPDLVRAFKDGTMPQKAGQLLPMIDKNVASQTFIESLTNEQLTVRIMAAGSLSATGLGTNAETITNTVRQLIECLNYESAERDSPGLRAASAGTLGYLKLEPGVTVPALLARLKVENQLVCRTAIIKALGRFEHEAEAALPILRPMTNDADPVIKSLAVKSVKQIEGKSP
jgi:hypothetical protein